MWRAVDYDEETGEYFSRPATEFDGYDPNDESQEREVKEYED